MLFGSVTLSIFVFATSVQNEALFVFTFLLITLGLLAMIMTNSNLRKIKISSPKEIVTSSGDTFLIHSTVETNSGLPHLGLCLIAIADKEKQSIKYKKIIDKKIDAFGIRMKIDIPGVHFIRELRAASIYPTGMFCAWKTKSVQVPIYVAPKAVNHLNKRQVSIPSDENDDKSEEVSNSIIDGIDEFEAHKEYIHTDRTSRIDWKVSARLQKLHVREYGATDEVTATKMIRLADYAVLSPKAALEQICFEVEGCFRAKKGFGLDLGSSSVAIGVGVHHFDKCRLELAKLFDSIDTSPTNMSREESAV